MKDEKKTRDAARPSRKPWIEPAVTFERPLEVHADGPPDKRSQQSFSFLGPLYASQNSGVCH